MHFRLILSGTMAVLLATSLVAPASAAGSMERVAGPVLQLAQSSLPGVFGGKSTPDAASGSIQLAQSGGVSNVALEEQIRNLNGKIEELNFQVLQMQEQIRKSQEDNEFRFQQLEGGGSGLSGSQKKSDASGVSERPVVQAPADSSAAPSGEITASSRDIIIDSGDGEPGKLIPGAPPKNFGTISVDKNGNVISAEPQGQAQTQAPAASGDGRGAVVAALPPAGSADELYRNSYQFILSGDYGTAEQGFRDLIARFPKDSKSADAHYWLGESLLGQQKYRDAAETFLAASKNYPKSKKAPDMLLKLGISLAGLKQRDVACATFAEIDKRYPGTSAAFKERVKQERSLAAC